MFDQIKGAIESVSAVSGLVGVFVEERDRQKAATIKVDLTNKITDAQLQLSQLLGTVIDQQRLISTLEQRIRELEAAGAEKERYELAKIGTRGQFFAYRLRSGTELDKGAGEVGHFVCQPCFEGGKKVVLTGNGSGYWSCPVCKHGAATEDTQDIAVSVRRRINFDGY